MLGTTFPAEALAAVCGLDEGAVRAVLDELVRREVLAVSADRLSPQKGSYGFAQNMLRQVAYGRLSRRDRKARHLKVAAYLRAAFAGEGEEVAEVIARHYLDALEAVPDAPDAGQIRGQAIAALVRAGERAERTGAPAQAVTSYATAAELSSQEAVGNLPQAGQSWERAAHAAIANADYAAATGHAGRAREYHLEHGDSRAAARAQATAGQALRHRGRHAEAREQLTAAVEVLRADPDADTVSALSELALVEVFTGAPDADGLSSEALALGQALGVGPGQLTGLFDTRGAYHAVAERRPQAVAYFTQAARLAEQAGDNFRLGRVLVNLADTLAASYPAAAAETARTAAGHLRQAGARSHLASVRRAAVRGGSPLREDAVRPQRTPKGKGKEIPLLAIFNI